MSATPLGWFRARKPGAHRRPPPGLGAGRHPRWTPSRMVIQYDRGTNTSSAKRIDMADAVGGRLPEGHGSANPRGLAAADGRSLAARLPRLDGARVLLVDNGKLTASYGPYDAIADALAALFPAATWIPVSLDLLRYDHTQIARIAGDLIATHAPDASVLALGDTGVSLQTTLLAALFEGSGVPASCWQLCLASGCAGRSRNPRRLACRSSPSTPSGPIPKPWFATSSHRTFTSPSPAHRGRNPWSPCRGAIPAASGK
jgi:hypothetical protein